MRLLLVNHEFTVSGSSTAFLRLALRLKAAGHSVTLFAVNPADGPIKPRYAEAGIPVVAVAVASHYDAAVLNTICAAPVLLQLASHVPTVWFVNEAEVALRLLLGNPAWAEAFRQAAAVIFNMPFQRDVLRSFTYDLDPARIHVLPFGVDVGRAALRRDRVPAKAHANDHRRSTTLLALAPLFALDGVGFVSLQKGKRQADVADYFGAAPLVSLGPELGGWDDTMAVLAGLDAVVTVDTAIAHLAGALGRAVHVMLPHAGEWRWLLGRDDSPWYPTMRLHRQTARGGWTAVASSVARALAEDQIP